MGFAATRRFKGVVCASAAVVNPADKAADAARNDERFMRVFLQVLRFGDRAV
jgi:hypothetical protein